MNTAHITHRLLSLYDECLHCTTLEQIVQGCVYQKQGKQTYENWGVTKGRFENDNSVYANITI